MVNNDFDGSAFIIHNGSQEKEDFQERTCCFSGELEE